LVCFRTVRGVVDPPEALRILWLVSLELCDWTKDREIECALPAATASALRWLQDQGGGGTNHANGSDVVFDGLMLDPSAGVCHHLSYVRTTSQLVHQKLASFAHAQDVLDAAEKRYNSTSSRNSGGTGSSSSSASTNGLARWISETWHQWEEVRCLFLPFKIGIMQRRHITTSLPGALAPKLAPDAPSCLRPRVGATSPRSPSCVAEASSAYPARR
jgi:hypothetical protein